MLTFGLLRESRKAVASFLDSSPRCPFIWQDEMISARAISIWVGCNNIQQFLEFFRVFCLAERPRCSVTPCMVFLVYCKSMKSLTKSVQNGTSASDKTFCDLVAEFLAVRKCQVV